MVPRIVTTTHLLAEGMTHSLIRAQVAAGELSHLRRGCYERVDAAYATPEDRHRALIDAVLMAHPTGVLSHVSAAVMHGLPIPQATLGRVHLLQQSIRSGSKRMDSLYLHRTTTPVPIELVDGLAVTPLDRTVLDLIRAMSGHDSLAVADRAVALGLDRETTLARLDHELRRRGNVQARRVLLLANPLAESPGESWVRWSIAEAGLPMPELQTEFVDPRTGRLVARTDFYWREHGLVGEFDGQVKYGRLLKPGQDAGDVSRRERLREEDLRRLGLWMVRVIASEAVRPPVVAQIVRDGIKLAQPGQVRDGIEPAGSARDGIEPAGSARDGSKPAGPARDGSKPAGPDRDGSKPAGPMR